MPTDGHPADLSPLQRDVLTHLHATRRAHDHELAAMLRVDPGEVREAIDRLIAAGMVERQGDRLVPVAELEPAPGVLVPSERPDTAADVSRRDGRSDRAR